MSGDSLNAQVGGADEVGVEEDIPERLIKNFLVDGGHRVSIFGTWEAIREFVAFVEAGYVLKPTMQRRQPGVVRALNVTLKAVHEEDGKPMLTVEEMLARLRTQTSEKSISTAFRPQPDSAIFSKHPDLSPARNLLTGIGQGLRERYDLGHVVFDQSLQAYRGGIIGHPTTGFVTKTIWIHNENMYERPSGDSRSGFLRSKEGVTSSAGVKEGWSSVPPNLTPYDANERASSLRQEDFRQSLPSSNGNAQIHGQNHGEATQSAESSRTSSSERVRKETKKGYKYREMISGAPAQDTDLPWETMAGVTSEELLTFFPNHAIHWPAICARLMEDGWTFQRIADYINNTRTIGVNVHHPNASGDSSNGAQSSGPSLHPEDRSQASSSTEVPDEIPTVLANTIMVSVSKGCLNFYGGSTWSYRDYSPSAASRNTEQRTAIEEKVATTKWAPRLSNRYSAPELQPAWSLKEIGRFFIELGGFPCAGSFTSGVELAATEDEPMSSYENSGEPMAIQNPPSLPDDWEPHHALRSEQTPSKNASVQRHLSPSTSHRVNRFRMNVPRKNERLSREEMLSSVRNDARAIIRAHPESVAGEVLLWILSAEGGAMTVQHVYEALKECFDEERANNSGAFARQTKALTRPTVSKRKEAALKERAKLNGTKYADERTRFDEQEAYKKMSSGNASDAEMEESDSQGQIIQHEVGTHSESTNVSNPNVMAPSADMLVTDNDSRNTATTPLTNSDQHVLREYERLLENNQWVSTEPSATPSNSRPIDPQLGPFNLYAPTSSAQILEHDHNLYAPASSARMLENNQQLRFTYDHRPSQYGGPSAAQDTSSAPYYFHAAANFMGGDLSVGGNGLNQQGSLVYQNHDSALHESTESDQGQPLELDMSFAQGGLDTQITGFANLPAHGSSSTSEPSNGSDWNMAEEVDLYQLLDLPGPRVDDVDMVDS